MGGWLIATGYDNLGVGRTPMPAEPFAIASSADHAAALRRGLRSRPPIRLVGTPLILGYRDAMGTSEQLGQQPRAKDRAELGRLAEEQAALRRVAMIVARGASSAELFEAVAHEVAEVVNLPIAAVCRYDDEGATMTILAICDDRPHRFQPGTRWPLQGPASVPGQGCRCLARHAGASLISGHASANCLTGTTR